MAKQIVFALTLLITLGVFTFTILRLISYFKFTKANFPIRDFGKRFMVMLDVAIGQTKIFRRPVIGFFHALVFWGFCVILFGSIEMIIDGLFGIEKSLKVLGVLHNIIMASGDVFALLAQAGRIELLLAQGLQRMVGFRNIAVHDYQTLQLPITVAIIEKHLDEFLHYSKALLQGDAF